MMLIITTKFIIRHKKNQVKEAHKSVTQENLMDAIKSDLEELFQGLLLTDSLGNERRVRVFTQDLPIREGEDEESDTAPEPYVLVRLQEGELGGNGERQSVSVVLVICVHDPSADRQGYRDALHIVNEILLRYGRCDIVRERYPIRYPIKWATQEEDTHPYYFAAMSLNLEAPAIFKEVPQT